jgi:hypothetical protein
VVEIDFRIGARPAAVPLVDDADSGDPEPSLSGSVRPPIRLALLLDDPATQGELVLGMVRGDAGVHLLSGALLKGLLEPNQSGLHASERRTSANRSKPAIDACMASALGRNSGEQ